MEKIEIRKLRDWRFFYKSPWGVFFSIILAIIFYRLYSIDTDSNNGKALLGINFAVMWGAYLFFEDFKNKSYSKYCRSIHLRNFLYEQIDNFNLKATSDNFDKTEYLKFLNNLYMDCSPFEHIYILSRIQSTINCIVIDAGYLEYLIETLKSDVGRHLDCEIENNTEVISILLEKG